MDTKVSICGYLYAPAMLRSPAMDALRAKYGKHLPHQRANVDQVPLPFVNDMETTYEQVGAKRVCINQVLLEKA